VDHGRLYAAGSNTLSQGINVLDLEADPEDPVLIGNATLPLGYVHDVHVVDNIAYASHGADQALTIYDYSDADDPVVIRTLDNYPEPGYNHSSWLDASGNRLVFADETHGMGLKCVNPNITEHQTTNYHIFRSNTGAIAHNPFIKGDLCYVAYYHDGVQVFDISDTNNIDRVAYYDTYSPGGYGGYEGCWGVYPYLESGIIIASDITYGLYVLTLEEELLPLEVINFEAINVESDARLTWKVTTPEDGQEFYVEHSDNGTTFEKLNTIRAVHSVLNYEFIHRDPGPGNHYYRIVVRHTDGELDPTPVRLLQFKLDNALRVRSTIIDQYLRVDTGQSGILSVISYDGREIITRQVHALERNEIEMNGQPAGVYYVVLRVGEENFVETVAKN
jgi:hypothetical protein